MIDFNNLANEDYAALTDNFNPEKTISLLRQIKTPRERKFAQLALGLAFKLHKAKESEDLAWLEWEGKLSSLQNEYEFCKLVNMCDLWNDVTLTDIIRSETHRDFRESADYILDRIEDEEMEILVIEALLARKRAREARRGGEEEAYLNARKEVKEIQKEYKKYLKERYV